MQLWLNPQQAASLLKEARQRLPEEACGLIAGRDGRVHRVVTIDNVAAAPACRFKMDGRQLARAILDFERNGLELYAIWHSHPYGEPVPSAADLREANWPEACHLIVGPGQSPPHMAAWKYAGPDVTRVPLHIGLNPPSAVPNPESRAQRFAIWASATMAFLLALWLAFTLLPPAPALP